MTEREPEEADAAAGGALPSNAQVRVPAALRRKIESRLAETEFESVDEYAAYVLESVLREIDERNEDDADAVDADAPPVDEAAVQDQLESLGYL